MFILPFRQRQHSQPDLSNEVSLCFDTGYNISRQEVGELMQKVSFICKNFVACSVVIIVIMIDIK